jgi:uncharacterized protein
MRYRTLKSYLIDRFKEPVVKISLDAGLTCPNRDGTLSRRGCLFCDEHGSGTGAAARGISIPDQLANGLKRAGRRANKFMAYFQSYTNTYAPTPYLKSIWDTVLAEERIVGLSIGTRPDCVSDQILDVLSAYQAKKEVWLELGLQTASDRTLELINRGHTAKDFVATVQRAKARSLNVLAHVIIGLPGESDSEIVQTARLIADLNLDGVKIHSLYITRNAGLADMYQRGQYECLTQQEFARLTVLFLENIPPTMVIHRLTGDPKPGTLIAPKWASDKHGTLAAINRMLEENDSRQGRELRATGL